MSQSVDEWLASGASEHLAGLVRASLASIEEAIDRYGTEDLVISFNGGKDCTVLLHLYAAVLARRSRGDAPGVYSLSVSSLPGALSHDIPAVYIFQPDPFDEVERFIATSADLYRLGITRVSTAGVKEGFQAFKEIRPSVSAILVGVRRTDPFSSNLSVFSPTDANWPQFMRVNPILEWTFTDVWGFLRGLGVPYCSLYDDGYTSLGSVHNTFRNPHLANESVPGGYEPAYKLTQCMSERDGRGTPQAQKPKGSGS